MSFLLALSSLSRLPRILQGQFAARQPQRASQLVDLLTTLGPTFIKVGQSLSIRSDLLPLAYLDALAALQDRVPAFDSRDAKAILAAELGRPVEEVFADLSAEPVAAASLGQVYKATLRRGPGGPGGGGEAVKVAVKVQRPGIALSVALDMHLIRTVAPAAKALLGLASDVVGTVDDWGAGFGKAPRDRSIYARGLLCRRSPLSFLIPLPILPFPRLFSSRYPQACRPHFRFLDCRGSLRSLSLFSVDELDYTLEAANAQRFTASIASTPLAGAVFAPPVVAHASTKRVLTTEWVDGERLERSSSGDVNAICSLCMNTYLTMLLETGMLHCDPHPGNLLRTPDGKLCILDWGLVTEIPPSLQLDFITHVAHLTSKDYAKVGAPPTPRPRPSAPAPRQLKGVKTKNKQEKN
jgi:predicted unusual protein kinase regulating ubiquinone biosynthesis (AarF/ABC1/UbiB family)